MRNLCSYCCSASLAEIKSLLGDKAGFLLWKKFGVGPWLAFHAYLLRLGLTALCLRVNQALFVGAKCGLSPKVRAEMTY